MVLVCLSTKRSFVTKSSGGGSRDIIVLGCVFMV